MTDVQPYEDTEAEVDPQAEGESDNPVADAIYEAEAAAGGVMYPEIDPLRGALSGMPAGNTDSMPPGTSEIVNAMEEALTPTDPEAPIDAKTEKYTDTAGARGTQWEVGSGTTTEDVDS